MDVAERTKDKVFVVGEVVENLKKVCVIWRTT